MLLIGKPSISMGHLYHGYVSHNQMVILDDHWSKSHYTSIIESWIHHGNNAFFDPYDETKTLAPYDYENPSFHPFIHRDDPCSVCPVVKRFTGGAPR
jgi:hypothetical protein